MDIDPAVAAVVVVVAEELAGVVEEGRSLEVGTCRANQTRD